MRLHTIEFSLILTMPFSSISKVRCGVMCRGSSVPTARICYSLLEVPRVYSLSGTRPTCAWRAGPK
jgi:hypothetical protein